MELTIEQALQQGLTAHQEGKLQDAERFYRAILRSQPTHPDANHNLGVIAVSDNKVDVALPLFKTAIEANPTIEQFWLSYVGALIKENQPETAKNVLAEGRKMGLVGDNIDALEGQVNQITQPALPKLPDKKKSLTLKEKRNKIAERKQQKKQAKNKNISDVSPSQSQTNKLLEHYESGRYSEAEELAVSITEQFPTYSFGWKALGELLARAGRKSEAANANQRAVKLSPQDAEAHNNLGNSLQILGKSEEAEASFRRAIALKPDYAEAYCNLGITLNKVGRLEEAEASYRQAIVLKPDFSGAHYNLGTTLLKIGRLEEAEVSYRRALLLKPDVYKAHTNLGNTLQELGRLKEAEVSYRQAISLKADYTDAHYNLGITLKLLGRLEEAAASFKQAISLKADYTDAHYNLGITLKLLGRLEEAAASFKQAMVLKPDYAEVRYSLGFMLLELGRLEEAEVSLRQAISLKPDYSQAHSNLGIIFAIKEDYESALDSVGRANDIEPMNKNFIVLKKLLKSRQSQKQHGIGFHGADGAIFDIKSTFNPLILSRAVEPELVANLYDITTRELDETPDTRFGNGKTTGYSLFEDSRFIMNTVEEDLMDIMKKSVKSNVVILESFFNIFRAGSGITIHNHLGPLDKIQGLNLSKQKYVLQYYLRVGDQNCSEPGVYKLYEPDEEILPSTGTIIIIPAGRMHSAVYGGDEDRVMIGINFYAL